MITNKQQGSHNVTIGGDPKLCFDSIQGKGLKSSWKVTQLSQKCN